VKCFADSFHPLIPVSHAWLGTSNLIQKAKQSTLRLRSTAQVSKEEAARRIEEIKEPYKLEILEDISRRYPDSPITIYHCGEPGSSSHWWDLCAGPHVETTGDINPAAVELESVAGDGSFQFYPLGTAKTFTMVPLCTPDLEETGLACSPLKAFSPKCWP